MTGLAATLRRLGYGRGDRIGLHCGQHRATAVAHMAVAMIGGIAITLSQLYGTHTLAPAMQDSATRVRLTGDPVRAALRRDRAAHFPDLTAHVRTRLAACKAPRDVAFGDDVVLTSSGKINRRLLREAEAHCTTNTTTTGPS